MNVNKSISVTLSVALIGSILLTGCDKETLFGKDPVLATASVESEMTTMQESETRPTYKKTIVNHGHSISETERKRPLEIRRSNTVLTNEEQARDYLDNSIKLKNKELSFVLTDTSDDDPGAFMWYQYTVFRNEIEITNAKFFVIAFYDGTICEGKSDIKSCTFADPKDVLSPEDALAKYIETNNDDTSYKFTKIFYNFTGKSKEKCTLQYSYRHEAKFPTDSFTLYLNANTGEFIGITPDAIN